MGMAALVDDPLKEGMHLISSAIDRAGRHAATVEYAGSVTISAAARRTASSRTPGLGTA